MAVKHEGIEGRSDVYRVNPEFIKVQEGWNPRVNFGGEADEELKDSIVENGVLIPIRVKKNGEGFILVDGERRLRAVKKAISEGNDIQSVPAIIERKNLSEIDAMVVSLLANTGKPLSPSEEAGAFQKLKNWGISCQDIAKKMGKSVPYVYDRLKLVDASPELKQSIDNKEVTLGAAKEIIDESEGSIEKQNEAVKVVKNEGNGGDGRKASSATSRNKPKKENVKVLKQDLEDLLNEAVQDYEETDDEAYRQFCGGMIRAYANMLEREDPIELDY